MNTSFWTRVDNRWRACLAITVVSLVAASARADLRITEIWPGGLAGDESTSDWIEVTNFGTTAINDLEEYHYRDTPVPDWVADGLDLNGGRLSGVSMLNPGESAVFMISWENPLYTPEGLIPEATLEQAREAFLDMWGFQEGDIKLGFMLDNNGTGGPGLSRDGDQVILYHGHVTGSPVVDTQSFPVSDPNSYILNPDDMTFGDLAQVGHHGAWEGFLPASDGLAPQKPVASPGVVPEPATLGMLAWGGLTLLRCRRK